MHHIYKNIIIAEFVHVLCSEKVGEGNKKKPAAKKNKKERKTRGRSGSLSQNEGAWKQAWDSWHSRGVHQGRITPLAVWTCQIQRGGKFPKTWLILLHLHRFWESKVYILALATLSKWSTQIMESLEAQVDHSHMWEFFQLWTEKT